MAEGARKTFGTGMLPDAFHFRARDRIPIRQRKMTLERRMLQSDPPTSGLAPALPVIRIFAKLTEVGFSGRAVRVLAHNTEFAVVRSRWHRIYLVAHDAEERLHRAASRSQFAAIFGANT
jgi:ABC-type histidine transport system ATPase subunit